MKSGFVVAMSALKGLDLHSGKIVSGEGGRLLRVERSKDIYPVQLDEASRFPLQKQAWKIRYFWEDADCDDGRFWGDPLDLDERVYEGDGEEKPRRGGDNGETVEEGHRREDGLSHGTGSVEEPAPERASRVPPPLRSTIAEYSWTTGPTNRFVLSPPSSGICPEAILARTTKNSKSKHVYEDKEILFGGKDSVRKRKLPISKGEKRIIETTVYYHPQYKAPDVRFDIDASLYGVFESEAGKVRKHRTSSNPGLPPALWRAAGRTEQAKFIEQFKREKRGVFHPSYLRINLELLRQIGLEPPHVEGANAAPAARSADPAIWGDYSVRILRKYSDNARHFAVLGRYDDPRWAAVYKRITYDAENGRGNSHRHVQRWGSEEGNIQRQEHQMACKAPQAVVQSAYSENSN